MSRDAVYRAVVESSPDALVVVSGTGEIVLVNEQALALLGYARDELVGQQVELLVPEASGSAHCDHRARFVDHAGGRRMAGDIELMARRRDGSEVAVEVSLGPVDTPEGAWVAAHVRDISARRSDGAALRLAEEQLRSAFDDAPIGMALVALDGTWLRVNTALSTLVGYPPADLLARRFQDITHPDDLSKDLNLLRRTLAGEMSGYQISKRYIHRLGHLVWIRLTVSLIRDDQGNPLHFVSQIEDVTERHAIEDELHESQRRLRAMFDHIPAGLSLRDLDGQYLAVNAFTARMLDSTPEALVGTDPGEHLDPATRATVAREDMRVAASRRPLVTDVSLTRPDGPHDYHVVRYPVIADDGSVTAFGSFSLDVTEQRQQDRARVQALEDLADAQRLARIGSWRWDTASDLATWSDEMYRVFGRDPAAGPATSEAFFAYVHPDDRERLAAGYAQTFGGGESFVLDYRIRRTDGAERVLHALGRRDEAHPGVYLGTVQDVTELRDAERRLALAEARFHGAFDDAPIGMAITDLSGRYEMVNSAFSRLTGYTADELSTRSIADVTHPDDRAHDVEILRALLDHEARSLHREKRYVRKDGTTVWVQVHATLLGDHSGGDGGQLLEQVLDVSARRRHEEELRLLAEHDALTGLPNRRGFVRHLELHLAHVGRYGNRGALLMFDLDNFKTLNDTRGHQAGDDALMRVAGVLARRLRESDIAGRLGGDEFVVLLTEADAAGAAVVARSILADSAAALSTVPGALEAGLTVSAGAVPVTQQMATIEDALAAADTAMYEAKATGRNRLVVHGIDRLVPVPGT